LIVADPDLRKKTNDSLCNEPWLTGLSHRQHCPSGARSLRPKEKSPNKLKRKFAVLYYPKSQKENAFRLGSPQRLRVRTGLPPGNRRGRHVEAL
jgi:hypothetical protein